MKLTKSKLELMLEAWTFNSMISNLSEEFDVVDESNQALMMEHKVNLSLSFASLTLDVNHLLAALIYLIQSVQKDLNSLIYDISA